MNFLKPVDRFLVTQVFQPIIQKSSWSQFTWSNVSTLFYSVSAIILANKEFIKGESDKIDMFAIIWFTSFGVWMTYQTNKNKKAGILKNEQSRILNLVLLVPVFIVFITRIEILLFVFTMTSTIYFQANMSEPFDEEIEE